MPELAFYFGPYKDVPISKIDNVDWLNHALTELIMDYKTRSAVVERIVELNKKELQK